MIQPAPFPIKYTSLTYTGFPLDFSSPAPHRDTRVVGLDIDANEVSRIVTRLGHQVYQVQGVYKLEDGRTAPATVQAKFSKDVWRFCANEREAAENNGITIKADGRVVYGNNA